jgi:hypothetical protein
MSKRPSPPAPARAAERTEDLLEAASSAILLGGQRLLALMLQTLGDGTPEDGEAFGMAGKQFRAVGTELGAAVPAGDWTGTGSDAYGQQNADQRGRAESIADTDHEVHRVLAGEAYQVTFHRKQIVELYNWLGELSRYTEWLGLVPRYGEAAKVVVEFAAVQTALTSAQCELKNMRAEAAANAMRLRALVDRYQAIAATALLPEGEFGGGPQPEPGPGSPVYGEAEFDGMGGRLGAPAPLRSAGGLANIGADGPLAAEGSAPGPEALEDTGDSRAAAGTEAQRDQPNPAAGLAGLVGVAGVVPALAAAVTAPLTALVAPAGGAVAAVVGAVAQGAVASQEPETAGDDEGEPAGPAGPDSAVPQQVIDPAAEDSGTGGSGTATVNADDTRVPDAAARPSAMGR